MYRPVNLDLIRNVSRHFVLAILHKSEATNHDAILIFISWMRACAVTNIAVANHDNHVTPWAISNIKTTKRTGARLNLPSTRHPQDAYV